MGKQNTMSKYDLSLLIPARNEEFLIETIEDILKNKRGKTEILVGLDGYWPEPGIPDHEDVTIVHYPESIGQRAMQNGLARISRAKYVMKADAHTAWDEGFDIKMFKAFEQAGDDATLVPQMRNLHVFNWKCTGCGVEYYMGPDPKICRDEFCDSHNWTGDNVPDWDKKTSSSFKKVLVWKPRSGTWNSAYRFNKNLRFKYFHELRHKLPSEGLQETMSLQGSCFMCTRENYWKKELCDETLGSWGMQGSEVAIKTWLSGGKVLVNMDTWYGHLFRTQPGFSHPYPNPGSAQQHAVDTFQKIFLNNAWPQQKYKLGWLLKKFWFALQEVTDPEARWEESDLEKYD